MTLWENNFKSGTGIVLSNVGKKLVCIVNWQYSIEEGEIRIFQRGRRFEDSFQNSDGYNL
jgi:deoxyadenosine/deoxycytidine kinase